MEERFFSAKRIKYCAFIAIVTVLVTGLAALFKADVRTAVCLIALDLVFAVTGILGLFSTRLRGGFYYRGTSYAKFTAAYLVSLLLAVLFLLLPPFTKPVILIFFVLSVFSSDRIAFALSIYFCIFICILDGADFYELCCCLSQLALFFFLFDIIKEKKYSFFMSTMLFCICFCISCIFYFISRGTIGLYTLFFAGVDSLVTVLAQMLFYRPLKSAVSKEENTAFDDILKDDYCLVKELRKQDEAEYNRQSYAMELAGRCALAVKADESLAKAGAFYYRLGLKKNGNFVENSLKIATDHCFPEKVIKLLGEYYGQEEKISTVESAIVHMVDFSIEKRNQLLSQGKMDQIGYSMLIHQTLNELSGKGYYDSCNLSNNRFLTIRDIIASEEVKY